ncbi:nucleoside 5-triphosphatase RdgB [Nonlabens ulvanivorans]|uniref:dITP/XTP pyrophosphatase n=1 Tax=Nonlabens ulvanivorans TaxID=906888 RepID=A0A081DE43_NONUL|nr:RdgB/HAM1 family non-canonical purine NTP pyrophosphatase [Nonlabens ulvanivorans]GAK77189.1 nucleoside 5-triphosphatase RdgB [Nonlabens ulvanivorans]
MEIIFATHNNNKLKEVQIMMPENIKLLSLDDIGMHEDIPETSTTISGNAAQKVQFIRQRYDLPVFADDTGLEVFALNNEPGVYSARYAGEHKSSEDNMELLLKNLEGKRDRSARFVTVFALDMDRCQTLFEGVCDGVITKSYHGDKGFGYDPIFMPNGYEKTFAQMSLVEKGEISHRGIALKKLIAYLT